MANYTIITNVFDRAFAPFGPWAARVVYTGPNGKNKSGMSSKWWEVRVTAGGRAEVNFGKIGSLGRTEPMVMGSVEAFTSLREKIVKGYRFDLSFKGPRKAPPLAHLDAPFNRINAIFRTDQPNARCVDADGLTVCLIPDSEARDLISRFPDLMP